MRAYIDSDILIWPLRGERRAAATGGKIYTQNLKHYPMPDIAVTRGW